MVGRISAREIKNAMSQNIDPYNSIILFEVKTGSTYFSLT